MNKMLRLTTLLSVALVLSPMLLFAAGPGFSSGVDDGGGACAAPLDGGISLLIAGGIGYGAKVLNKFKKQSDK